MAKRVLSTSGLRDMAERRLVSLHVDVFTDRSPADRTEERRAYLEALFDVLIDAYRAGLETGATEARARERVHVMANLCFWQRGWTECMEFPADEITSHLDRHEAFFDAHDVTPETPLGTFEPDTLPDAPATPEKRINPTFPNADPGFADGVYVEDADGTVHPADERNEPTLDVSKLPEYIRDIESRYDVSPSLTGRGD